MAQWEKGPRGSGPLKECLSGKGLREKVQLEMEKRQAPWLLLSPCCVETSAESLSHCLPAGTDVFKVAFSLFLLLLVFVLLLLRARADCMPHSPITC